MITRVQAVAYRAGADPHRRDCRIWLVLVPLVKPIWRLWNVSGLGTFGAIQSTLNVTLWSFIGVESASVAAGVVKNPKRNVPIATIGGVLIAAVCYVLSTTAIMG